MRVGDKELWSSGLQVHSGWWGRGCQRCLCQPDTSAPWQRPDTKGLGGNTTSCSHCITTVGSHVKTWNNGTCKLYI